MWSKSADTAGRNGGPCGHARPSTWTSPISNRPPAFVVTPGPSTERTSARSSPSLSPAHPARRLHLQTSTTTSGTTGESKERATGSGIPYGGKTTTSPGRETPLTHSPPSRTWPSAPSDWPDSPRPREPQNASRETAVEPSPYSPQRDDTHTQCYLSSAVGEWGELAFLVGAANWRDVADFAIEQTLLAPASMSPPQ